MKTLMKSHESDTMSNRIVHISVQLFSNEELARHVTEECQLLDIMVTVLLYMMESCLIKSELQGNKTNMVYAVGCTDRSAGDWYRPIITFYCSNGTLYTWLISRTDRNFMTSTCEDVHDAWGHKLFGAAVMSSLVWKCYDVSTFSFLHAFIPAMPRHVSEAALHAAWLKIVFCDLAPRGGWNKTLS